VVPGPQRPNFDIFRGKTWLLAVEDIDHSRTKTKSPQTNGICERFHKTVLNEFYRVAFRKKVYRSIDELQADLDAWMKEYNEVRPHQRRRCFGKTPIQTFLDAMPKHKDTQATCLGPLAQRETRPVPWFYGGDRLGNSRICHSG
jgi:hypothetical protein